MHDSTFTLVAIIAVVTVCYVLRVAAVPFKTCRRCGGMGRIRPRTPRGRPKDCRRCRTTGLRPRLSRRLFNTIADAWRTR